MRKRFSIVIPTYNEWPLTHQCLAQLRRIFPNPYTDVGEVIVVIDGGTDVTKFEIPRLHPLVNVVELPENRGFANACNAGVAMAQEEIVILLNNDTIPAKGFVEPLLDELEDPSVGLVGTMQLEADGRTVDHLGIDFAMHSGGYPIPCHLWSGTPLKQVPEAALKPHDVQGACGAVLAFRRKQYLEFGQLDPSFRNGWEDLDLSFRFRIEYGLRTRVRPDSRVVHLASQSKGRFDRELENRSEFYERWAGQIETLAVTIGEHDQRGWDRPRLRFPRRRQIP